MHTGKKKKKLVYDKVTLERNEDGFCIRVISWFVARLPNQSNINRGKKNQKPINLRFIGLDL